MRLKQIRINISGQIIQQEIYVNDFDLKSAKTYRIQLPCTHENILNRVYVELGYLNKKLSKSTYELMSLCLPEKEEEVLKMLKEERKDLLERVLIPTTKASLYCYEQELEKLKAEENKTPAPEEKSAKEKPKKEDKPEVVKPTPESEPTPEVVPEEKPVAEPKKSRGRRKKDDVPAAEIPTKKPYNEMNLAELKAECAARGIVPASRNKEKIIAQLMENDI